ncbi:hypothetical protein POL68_32435 [Stigmatella sp. ncwal1]|uniref:DUF3592 domain-containing protein n=1 Tax=Stigmatella ashevillensis TaxID=2995309 RepID=A0ABT5DHT6_9BACT|nr:hypothetical protein [Stigmatella ashevillena]MDC0713215.1 hypothetical protein [Stigmatella ashevillena]
MRWIGIFLLGLTSLGLFALALHLTVKAVDFSAYAVSVPGVVSGYKTLRCTSTDKNKRQYSYTCYQYLVRYELQGTSRESLVEQDRASQDDEVGKAVELSVDPRTGTVYFAGIGIWIGPLILAFFGLATLLGLGFFLKSEGLLRRPSGLGRPRAPLTTK